MNNTFAKSPELQLKRWNRTLWHTKVEQICKIKRLMKRVNLSVLEIHENREVKSPSNRVIATHPWRIYSCIMSSPFR